MIALAIIPDDVLSKGDMHDVYDESDSVMLLNLVNHSTYKGADNRCMVSPSVLAAVSSLTAHDVVLDAGAGVSVFKNTNHLVDIRDDHVPIEINDLTVTNEPLCTSTLGSSEFGDVYVSANILSYGRVKDSDHAVWQSAKGDVFRVQIVEEGKVYQFKRRCGV